MRHKAKVAVAFAVTVLMLHLATSGGYNYGKIPVNSNQDKGGTQDVIIDPDFGTVDPSRPDDLSKPDDKPGLEEVIADTDRKGAEDAAAKPVDEPEEPEEPEKVPEKEPEVEAGTGDGTGDGADGAIGGTDDGADSVDTEAVRSYQAFFQLDPFTIKSPSIKDKYKTDKAAEKFSGNDDFLFSKEYLEEVLDIPDSTVAELKTSHTGYINHMETLITKYKLSTFGNILQSDGQWKDYQGSKGYVLIGGGKYSWLSYLVIKQIRATGSNLPIELFIPSSKEYEKKFCEEVLPGYNARCNVFADDMTEELRQKFGIGGYQYKMLAILSSRFENVVYLDSDNFPVRNPEFILESQLYKDRGLMLWPDAWARTTNPKFYDIAGVDVQETKVRYSKYDEKHGKKPLEEYTFQDSRYHDFQGTLPDPTSETGMLIVNKTSHLRTLLLCLYYNVFGPHFYYPLMTQGSAGEGDKESFIAAAHVLGEPWFQTLKLFRWCGYVSEAENKFTSKALGHFDPIQSESDPDGDLDIVFMHLSYPKFYPNWLVDNHDLIYKELGRHIRMYGDIYKSAGYDFDLRVLQFFTQGLCKEYYQDGMSGDLKMSDEYMGGFLEYVKKDEEKNSKRCREVFLPHLEWLKETSEYEGSVVQPKKGDDY